MKTRRRQEIDVQKMELSWDMDGISGIGTFGHGKHVPKAAEGVGGRGRRERGKS